MFRVNDYVNIDGKEYLVSKFLGQGGMGNVFLIEDKMNDSRFALKPCNTIFLMIITIAR